jgi:hypothetical protein
MKIELRGVADLPRLASADTVRGACRVWDQVVLVTEQLDNLSPVIPDDLLQRNDVRTEAPELGGYHGSPSWPVGVLR